MGYISLDGLDIDNVNEWDGVQTDFEPPMQGEYVFRVDNVEEKKSKSSGQPMLEFDIEIVSLADGTETDQVGKTFKEWRSLQRKALGRFKQLAGACGVDLSEGGFQSEDFVGMEFVGQLIHDSYTKQNQEGDTKTYTNARVIRERPVE